MALNFMKIRNGITLSPQASTAVTTQGDVDYNSSNNKIEVFTTQVEDVATDKNVLTLSNKTLQTLVGVVVTDAATTGSLQTLPSGDIAGVTVKLTNTSLASLAGIAAGVDGQTLILENLTTGILNVFDNSASASAANRIRTGTGQTVALPTNGSLLLQYNGTTSLWMLIGDASIDAFLQTQVITDATTTGSVATLLATDPSYGVVRLTNVSLVSVSGIPAGATGQQIIVENQTGNTITINNNDAGATAANRIFTGTGGSVTMASNASFSFVYDTTASRWMLIGGTGSGSGSGDSKNYLSVYTASTSSGVPNTGNGNWEAGSTAGWSAAHSALTSFVPTSVASAGTAFSNTNGGSNASGNFTLGTVTSGSQIAGTYSGQVANSTASTAGDMIISSAFFIDQEDQAKVMTAKMYYKVVTLGGLNFSGTNANGFALYVYDVTNGAWIQPAGVYGMTQNSGVGYVTATFQTTSNSTQYQLALININASTSGYQILVDDISVGPQTAPIGYAGTDWISFTPTGTWVANSTYNGRYRRVGDSAEIQMEVALTGAPTSATLNFNMPSGLVIDATKLTTDHKIVIYGQTIVLDSAGSQADPGGIDYVSSTSIAPNYIGQTGTTTNGATLKTVAITQIAPKTFATGDSVTVTFCVPIVGWSSNVQMSNDTDTRVVECTVYKSTSSTYTSASPTILWDTVIKDTHGMINTSTGVFTIPVSGDYLVMGNAEGNANTVTNNFSAFICSIGGAYAASGRTGSTTQFPHMSGANLLPGLVAGQTLTIAGYSDNNITLPGGSTSQRFSIIRLSGPAVVAATESVNASYTTAAGQSIPTGSATTVVFGTKAFDSHGAMNASTGVYTVPVSGKYLVTGGLYTATAVTATDTDNQLQLLKNSSLYQATNNPKSGATAAPLTCAGSFLASCNAGDTLALAMLQTSGASQTLITSAAYNFFNVCRVGN